MIIVWITTTVILEPSSSALLMLLACSLNDMKSIGGTYYIPKRNCLPSTLPATKILNIDKQIHSPRSVSFQTTYSTIKYIWIANGSPFHDMGTLTRLIILQSIKRFPSIVQVLRAKQTLPGFKLKWYTKTGTSTPVYIHIFDSKTITQALVTKKQTQI